MLDCENRLAAAEYFLDRAEAESQAGDFLKFVWNIQASVLFVVSALDILRYDYGEAVGISSKSERLEAQDFKARAKRQGLTFYEWLDRTLDSDNRYGFFREERNLIVHRGERPKTLQVDQAEIFGDPKVSLPFKAWFQGWESEPIDVACRAVILFARNVISQAKSHEARLAGS